MGKKKVKTINLETCDIYTRCPNCNKEILLNNENFNFWSAPCELCGEHGGKDVEYCCDTCKTKYQYKLDTW